MRPGVWPRPLAAAIAAALTLCGCAAIPSAGPVREGAEVRSDEEPVSIRTIARPPRPGMTPVQLVNGFLEASASFEGDHAVAREYLTPDRRADWDPAAGVVVYDVRESGLAPDGDTVLTLTGTQVASISPQGELTPAPADAVATGRFVLTQLGADWRISELPQGLLLTEQDVQRAFRPFDLHFLEPSASLVVPNQVLLPQRAGIGATLVRELLRGPTEWLAPAVVTAFPEGTDLAVDSVPIEDGVAQVDLTSEVLEADASARQALSAQLVWTLRQLPEVTSVEITVQGVPLDVPGVPDVQPRSAWEEFDPDAGSAQSRAYAVVDDRLSVVTDGKAEPVAGAVGDGTLVLSRSAVSPDELSVAGLSADQRTLFVGPLAGASLPAPAVAGTSLTAPSWDSVGTAWTVDRTADGAVVWTVGADGVAVVAASPELAALEIDGFRVARDGVRATVVVDGQLFVARIVRDGGLTVQALRPIAPAIQQVDDATWYDADRVLAIGERGGVREAVLVSLSGGLNRLGGALPGLRSVSGVIGRPVLAATDDGLIWQLTDTGWQELLAGRDPAYPG